MIFSTRFAFRATGACSLSAWRARNPRTVGASEGFEANASMASTT